MRLITIILAVLLYGPIPCSGQAQQSPQNVGTDNQDASANHQNQADTTAVAKQANSVEDYTGEEAKAATEQATCNRWIMYFTGALMLIGLIQAIVYSYQSYLMRNSIDQSRKSSEQQLRAYVGIANFSHEAAPYLPNIPPRYPNNFDVILKNTGQTPAYNGTCYMDWVTVRGTDAIWPDGAAGHSDSQIREFRDNLRGSRFTLGSGEMTKLEQPLINHADGGTFAEAHAKMLAGAVTIFLFGTIVYDDVFTKDRPKSERMTQFCFQLFLDDGTTNYRSYDRHNKIT